MYEKLKSEMREKENAFDLMLLQLRSHNIAINNRAGTIDTNNKEKR